MVYTPTGKRVGRPKTKDYQTISLKMPQELLDRVQVYARLHRQSLSELMRDGVEWRITEGDLRGVGVDAPQRPQRNEDEYYGNTAIPAAVRGEPEDAGILHEIRSALARQEMQLHALTQALEQRTVALASQEYSGNTALQELSKPLPLVDTLIPFDDDLSTTDSRAETTTKQDNSCHTVLHERGEPDTAPSQPQGETGDDTRQTEHGLVPREQTALAAPVQYHGQRERSTDDLEDMPLEPENGPATLVRQPENEPSSREAPPAETADTPSEDTPRARRRALLLSAVPWEADTPAGVNPVAIRTATGISKIDVTNDLDELCKHGQVVKVSKGHYARTGPMATAPQGKAAGARARRQAKPQAPP